MRSRRPALILLIVLVVLTGALNASERDRSRATRTASTPAAAAAGKAPDPAVRTIEASLPSSRPVRARTGDTVVLRVRSKRPDIAEILAVGARTPVGPNLPGVLRFVAGTPGDLDVDLEVAGRRAGVVKVTRRPS